MKFSVFKDSSSFLADWLSVWKSEEVERERHLKTFLLLVF